jgi:hypothetical protein
MAAREDGMDFATLCWRVLETSCDNDNLARKSNAGPGLEVAAHGG